MRAALPAFLIVMAASAASAQAIPDYGSDRAPYCESVVEFGGAKSVDECVRTEAQARAKILRLWGKYPQAKRTRCIRDGEIAMMGAGYDVLRWCLEN